MSDIKKALAEQLALLASEQRQSNMEIGKFFCDAEVLGDMYPRLVADSLRLLRLDAHEIDNLKAAYRQSRRGLSS